ncbi:hypothetical protein Q5752_005318 [Cryptotrichosporon argae]
MSAPRNPPFRAEHLGSLLRPRDLLAARTAAAAAPDDAAAAAALKDAEDRAVADIVKTQLDLGYSAVSDGEYRRGVFWGSFFQTLDGFTEVQNPPLSLFRTYVPDIAGFLEKGGPGQSCLCTGRIAHRGASSFVAEWQAVDALLPADRKGQGKLTIIAPPWYHLRYKEGHAYPKDVYANDKEYFDDIAKAFHTELDILYEAGVRNIQIDDPNFAYFCSEKMIEGWAADTSNTQTLDELLDTYISAYNAALSRHKDKMHFGVHICRGNFRGSRHFSEGGYDRIAAKLFQKLDVATYYLEYDTERAGSFEPLLHLPKHKNVVLGVVSTKFDDLEDKAALRARVELAADYMARGAGTSMDEALGRISVSGQCGFASHEEGNSISWDGMINKLKLVRELADDIWPSQP